MQKEFEKLQEIFTLETTEVFGVMHTNIVRKDNKRLVDLYDFFLETLKVVEENYTICKKHRIIIK